MLSSCPITLAGEFKSYSWSMFLVDALFSVTQLLQQSHKLAAVSTSSYMNEWYEVITLSGSRHVFVVQTPLVLPCENQTVKLLANTPQLTKVQNETSCKK